MYDRKTSQIFNSQNERVATIDRITVNGRTKWHITPIGSMWANEKVVALHGVYDDEEQVNRALRKLGAYIQ